MTDATKPHESRQVASGTERKKAKPWVVTVGVVLTLLLVVWAARLVEVGLISTLGVDGCAEYIPHGCEEFSTGTYFAVVGTAVVGIVAVVLALIFIGLRRRWLWVVPVAGGVVSTILFFVGIALETAALGENFWNTWWYGLVQGYLF